MATVRCWQASFVDHRGLAEAHLFVGKGFPRTLAAWQGSRAWRPFETAALVLSAGEGEQIGLRLFIGVALAAVPEDPSCGVAPLPPIATRAGPSERVEGRCNRQLSSRRLRALPLSFHGHDPLRCCRRRLGLCVMGSFPHDLR
jgi:hypothetical protein